MPFFQTPSCFLKCHLSHTFRSFTTSFVFPSCPVGMITSHRACRRNLQILHYIQTYMHTYIHTTFSHTIFLCHTRSFAYNFVPHNSFNFSILHHLLCLSCLPRPATTFVAHGPHTHNLSPHNFLTHNLLTHNFLTHNLLTHGLLVAHANPSPSLFSFLHFPCHLYLSFAACWKKLTCGVIRPFNLTTWTKQRNQLRNSDLHPEFTSHLKGAQHAMDRAETTGHQQTVAPGLSGRPAQDEDRVARMGTGTDRQKLPSGSNYFLSQLNSKLRSFWPLLYAAPRHI